VNVLACPFTIPAFVWDHLRQEVGDAVLTEEERSSHDVRAALATLDEHMRDIDELW